MTVDTAVAQTRTIADPGPLGLAGFAATTFMLSVINAGLLTDAVTGAVLGLALFYGGIVQVGAGMWEFAKGNTFGAVAFSSYGGFWLSYWYLVKEVLPGLDAPEPDVHHAVGVYLLVWTIFSAYMMIAASRVSGILLGVFVVLTLTFGALCIGDLAGSVTFTRVGGWLGLITAILAWYASMAAVVNSTFGKTVLPTFVLAAKS